MMKMLSNEELVVSYQESKSEVVLSELLKRMEGIMTVFCSNYTNIPNVDEVDKMGELKIAYLKVLDNFDITKGCKLTTACRTYFTQTMNKLYEENTRQKRYDPNIRQSSYDEIVELHMEGEETDIRSVLNLQVEEQQDFEFLNLLDSLKLSPKERMTCGLISSGSTKSETARAIGVTPAMVKLYLDSVGRKMLAVVV